MLIMSIGSENLGKKKGVFKVQVNVTITTNGRVSDLIYSL